MDSAEALLSGEHAHRCRRILLVEDDLDMSSLLAERLREEGYAVDAAMDGTCAALILFLARNGLQRYDLVLSDVFLPGVSGLELTAHLGEAFGPPVLLMSAFVTPALAHAAQEAGAIAVIPKPFELERLLTSIRRLVPPPSNES
jgi:DNA-binding response OmpR family regulator